MIKLRRTGHNSFAMEFENGNTKISEDIGLDDLVSIFDEAAHALTDNATRTLMEIREQRLQIATLKKELSNPTPAVTAA